MKTLSVSHVKNVIGDTIRQKKVKNTCTCRWKKFLLTSLAEWFFLKVQFLQKCSLVVILPIHYEKDAWIAFMLTRKLLWNTTPKSTFSGGNAPTRCWIVGWLLTQMEMQAQPMQVRCCSVSTEPERNQTRRLKTLRKLSLKQQLLKKLTWT